MKLENYHVKGEEKIVSPALIYYRDAIVKNTQRTIELAGGANRLWYHVKTHKTRELVKMQMEMGFTHFMCATISEAEMAASVGAENVLVAYALVGPNIERFIDLTLGMPGTQFWALGDDYDTLLQLSAAAREKGITIPVLLDVNVGQDRTGVLLSETADYYERCSRLPNLQMRGLHCYDGHNHQVDVEERQKAVDEMDRKIEEVSDYFLSPGTSFVMDARYGKDAPDLKLWEAGAIMTRVVSHPASNTFTLDLGSKGISCDQPVRGELVGVAAKAMFQSEEHWLWKMEEGHEAEHPQIGDILYVIPSHICPTTVLYPSILVAENGKIVDEWETVARVRMLTY